MKVRRFTRPPAFGAQRTIGTSLELLQSLSRYVKFQRLWSSKSLENRFRKRPSTIQDSDALLTFEKSGLVPVIHTHIIDICPSSSSAKTCAPTGNVSNYEQLHGIYPQKVYREGHITN